MARWWKWILFVGMSLGGATAASGQGMPGYGGYPPMMAPQGYGGYPPIAPQGYGGYPPMMAPPGYGGYPPMMGQPNSGVMPLQLPFGLGGSKDAGDGAQKPKSTGWLRGLFSKRKDEQQVRETKVKSIPGAGPPVLTDDGTPNAFGEWVDTTCYVRSNVYGSFGTMALMRQQLGSSTLTVQDPGVSIPGFPRFFDHGFFIANQPEIINYSQLGMDFNWGVRGSIGVQYDRDALELSYFYLWGSTSEHKTDDPNRLNVMYAFPPFPFGFSGDNRLWLQADRVIMYSRSDLASVELNYRYTLNPGLEVLYGVRYFDLQENFTVYTDDDSLTTVGTPQDPTEQAYIISRVHDRILAPQLGFEGMLPLSHGASIGFTAKGAVGANFVQVRNDVVRGDGFTAPPGVAPNFRRSETLLSQVYELGLFADWLITDRIRVRAGYTGIWLVGVPEAHEQINFDLRFPRSENAGSIFYHGPMFELHVHF